MRLYATATAYEAAGYGTAPSNIDMLLRTASRTVDTLLLGRAYDVDATTGLPTDADVALALSDATCAIAAELDSAGALAPGSTTAYASVGIGNVSLSGRQASESSLIVDGVPVPAIALQSLAGVGRVSVSTASRGYVRPLDRVAL